MRIALITPEHPGCGPSFGVGSYVRTQAGMLGASGHAVLVLVAGEAGRFRGEGGDQPRPAGRLPGPALLRPWRAAGWLDRELSDWRAEVVELANWGGLGAGLGGGRPLVVRLSTPVGTIASRGLPARLTLPFHRRWEQRTVVRAEVVVANSQAMAALALDCYGRAADLVIPHAWTGAVAGAPAPAAEGVLAVGRIERRKGSDVLLAAWPAVRARRPDAVLHLVGADRLGLDRAALAAAGVIVHGVLDDAGLERIRRDCAVQAIPSRAESFGLVVLEAWAAGLAVVAADCSGLAETVGDAGELVPVGDAPRLAEAIVACLARPERRHELFRRGVQRLRERFSAAAWTTATLEAYALAAQRHRDGRASRQVAT
jgi:glycosyltransferase involved in cell wall biosynthesis